ncbi:LysR substrate-binding domain-containing protein [Labrys monachus]|uniref:LysR family glycine cleavage system transcriptional activator n=1 Tax=Labrys monachus TaxID=217067 RepID=A0ABU0FAQ5_9HYPH|nr:LysR substrate-binding domain-containing protein [Labrys monachus]MDQ0391412.1 LysR family glycine cleavage system transcriptional activator [Labrys monachus]
MRKRRLPPLNALRGFEASARHLSFTKAAEELSLTQGAVSRQVQELEAYCGEPLFRRMTRRIELTPEGEQLFRVVEAMLDDLERAANRFGRRDAKKKLTITALPTIATVWLMPRLHLFTSRNPDIEVRIVSSIEPADLLATDIAIRVGRLPGRHYERTQPRIELSMVTRWDGIHADELFPDRLRPVCAPGLIRHSPVTAEDLALYPLIHTSTRRYAWPDWLRAHGIRHAADEVPSLQFGHFFMSLDAARQGRGIALVPDIILAHEEGMRGLVVPLAADIASAGEYYLLIHEARLDDPSVQAFRAWAIEEARAVRKSPGLAAGHEPARP